MCYCHTSGLGREGSRPACVSLLDAGAGSGKTATFLIPVLERLKEHSTRVGVRAVVLSPTRELAMQTAKFLKAMAKYTTLRYTLLVGGDSMEMQVRA